MENNQGHILVFGMSIPRSCSMKIDVTLSSIQKFSFLTVLFSGTPYRLHGIHLTLIFKNLDAMLIVIYCHSISSFIVLVP